MGDIERLQLAIHGTIQGVGFRPFVWRLAHQLGLSGYVKNAGDRVVIEVQGNTAITQEFVARLIKDAPGLAHITGVDSTAVPTLEGEETFEIAESEVAAGVAIPPDVATCRECLEDILDPSNRRCGYAFTNCTSCGPRFTFVTGSPYDRERTTMAGFPMCEECHGEFYNPVDRRFHAEPIACPECGPKEVFAELHDGLVCTSDDWLGMATQALRQGRLVGVKGAGGFHLACDAQDEAAVARVRALKARGNKPLALMARSLDDVARVCEVGPEEKALLEGPAAPIVVLKNRQASLWPGVSGGTGATGFLLPYTPLHHLLLREGPAYLVMTSLNHGDMPLVYRDEDAFALLGRLVDSVITHNRPIARPCDDSVVRWAAGSVQVIRRSRGFVPSPIALPAVLRGPRVLAAGGDTKNTFCLSGPESAVMSQHIGDMDSLEAASRFKECVTGLASLLGFGPEAVAVDSHPLYESAGSGRELAAGMGLPVIQVQHHHAHMCSVLAEHCLQGPAVAMVADSVGYGDDGAVWGCEILTGSCAGFSRRFHLEYARMPGPKAVRSPLWSALAFLRAGEQDVPGLAQRLFPGSRDEVEACLAVLDAGWNCFASSSAGRLLDAAAAILGLCLQNTYEGEGAVLLDAAACGRFEPYPFEIATGMIRMEQAVSALVCDVLGGSDRARYAGRFIDTLAAALGGAAIAAARAERLGQVVASGGVFQSPRMLSACRMVVEDAGLQFLTNEKVPPNDGGLALGQAAVAAARLKGLT